MICKKFRIVICLCVMTISSAFAENTVRLVSDGKPDAVIAISENANKSVSFAAEELQKYIGKMSGAKLPILKIDESIDLKTFLSKNKNAIIVGENKYASELGVTAQGLKEDGYRIETKENALIILGRDSRNPDITLQMSHMRDTTNPRFNPDAILGCTGTLYGVYGFLEELGIRWFYPGQFGEIVPTERNIVINNMEIRKEPFFKHRAVWSARWPYTKEDTRWERQIGFGPGEVMPDLTCHYFTSWKEKYQKSHPEYFAVNGKTKNFNHICFNNSAARERMLQDIREFFISHPDPIKYPYFCLSHNDGYIRSCDCELCKTKYISDNGALGTDSQIVVETAIYLAEKIKKEFPDRGILIAAYNNYLRPPQNIARLPDNVAVWIAHASCLHYWSEDTKESMREIIEGWQKLKPKELFFGEYYDCDARNTLGVPMLAPHFIAQDIAYLKTRSEKTSPISGGLIFSVNFNPFEPQQNQGRLWWFGLNYYVTAKLQWDPTLDVDKLLEDYFNKFYGPAALPIKKYFDKTENTWATGDHGTRNLYGSKKLPASWSYRKQEKFYSFVKQPWEKLFTREVMAELAKYLDEAEQLAKNEPYKERVAFLKKGFAYMQQCSEKEMQKKKAPSVPEIIIPEAVKGFSFDDDKDYEQYGKKATLNSTAGKALTYGTNAYLLYDKDYLYIDFICAKASSEKCKAVKTNRDSPVWEDESLEIFITCDGTRENFYHIVVNTKGISADIDDDDNFSWDPALKISTVEENGQWKARIGIPFASFKKQPEAGDVWYFNLCRNRYTGENAEYQSLFPTGKSYHNPSAFGKLIFSHKKKVMTSIADSDKLGEWDFDEGSGKELHDKSGKNNTGYLQGDAQWTNGISGAGLSLDGVNSKAILKFRSDGQTKNLLSGLTELTVQVWIYPKLNGANILRVSENQLILHADGNSGAGLYLKTDEHKSAYVNYKTGAIVPDEWNYIVGTYDGKSLKLYVNENLQNTVPLSGKIIDSPNDLMIGTYFNDNYPAFEGKVDNLSILKKALTEEEVGTLFESYKR